jgi:hypothetical protein
LGHKTLSGALIDSCLAKVKPGEPFFTLRAQDLLAPWAVRQWAARAQENGTPQEKIDAALALAAEMEEWARKNSAKVPD